MKRFLFKNDYAVFATVIASFLNDFGVLYDFGVPVVFSQGKLQTAVIASGDRRFLVCVFLRKTQGFSNLKKNALGLVRALIFDVLSGCGLARRARRGRGGAAGTAKTHA